MQITCLHSGIGTFNGAIYFLVDDRLLTIKVCTPNFNDYNEFRLSELTLSTEKYKPEENTIELQPYDIAPYSIDNEELEFLNKWFTNAEDIEYAEEESPYNYLDLDAALTSCNFENGYRHAVFRREDWQDRLDCFRMRDDTWKLTSEIPPVKLYEEGGLYCLLAHISDGIFRNYYK